MKEFSDEEILATIKSLTAEYKVSVSVFFAFAKAMLEWQGWSVMPLFEPWPNLIEEITIDTEIFDSWPSWVRWLVPEGSKWECLHWPDGSATVRLVDRRARVLAAEHLMPTTSEQDKPPKKPQTVEDVWQEQRDHGLTQSQLMDRMNSLPPIETTPSHSKQQRSTKQRQVAKVRLEMADLSLSVQAYLDLFGHEPAAEAEKYLTPMELDRQAQEAVDKGEPIPEWRDRATTKTGTLLDNLYK